MLAGTTWGAGAKTIRTSALALCYSVAEYCAQFGGTLTYQSRRRTIE